MPDDCWACQLAAGDLRQHKTRWFYVGSFGVVVEDLNPKEYTMRLLFVSSNHVPCGKQTGGDRIVAMNYLVGVAKALEVEGGLQIIKWDLENHSFKSHWHAQVCLDQVPDPANEAWD